MKITFEVRPQEVFDELQIKGGCFACAPTVSIFFFSIQADKCLQSGYSKIVCLNSLSDKCQTYLEHSKAGILIAGLIILSLFETILSLHIHVCLCCHICICHSS